MGNTPSSSNWPRCYSDIKINHDEAYRTIQEAISLEEQERPHEAIEKYKEGILLIDKALNIQVTFPQNPNDEFQKACTMIQKMKKTRAEVLTRINCIQSSPTFTPVPPPAPPTYDEAVGVDSGNKPQTYVELAAELENIKVDNLNMLIDQADIIYSLENVRLYYIAPSGDVTASSEGHTLRIALVEGHQGGALRSFLQVGDWVYPLVPGVSPCYRTRYGAFIFPDLHSNVPGCSVGFMLSETADSDVYDLLESILHGIVGDVSQKELQEVDREEPGVGQNISRKLTSGAYFVSQGIIKGAEKTGNLLNLGTPKLIGKLSPANGPATIPSGVSRGLKIAGQTTNTAANVTGFVAEKVGVATTKLGHFLAPHIKKQGTRILTSGFKLSEQDASSKVDGVLTVAAGAVEGFSTIYRGLETSAGILGKSLKDNSVKVVQHKYGQPAGEAASDTLDTVGNVVTIAHNSKIFTPKGLAKRTVKEAGKAMVHEYRDTVTQSSHNQHPTMLPTYSQAMGHPEPSTSSSMYPTLPSSNEKDMKAMEDKEKK